MSEWGRTRSHSAEFAASLAGREPQVHEHWVYDFTVPTLVEPRAGYVFLRAGLVSRSFSWWYMIDRPPVRSFADYARWLFRPHTFRHYPVAVSLLGFVGEGNYWHFQADALSKLPVVDSLDLPPDAALLVSPRVWHAPWFAQIRSAIGLRHRNWVLHETPISADRLIVCNTGSLRRQNFVFAHDLFELADGDRADPRSSERLFVTRSERRTRHLANGEAVAAELSHLGFTEVDADDLGFWDQVQRFEAASCVVLVHGAALANLIHRIGRPTAVVELFSPDHVGPQLAWLAREFDFEYRAVMGSRLSPESAFSVDVGSVVRAVDQVITALEQGQP